MRKIEREMIRAITERKFWRKDNMQVYVNDDLAEVLLHNNRIATVYYDTGKIEVDIETLRDWQTPTTKSRLRALGKNVRTKRGVTYLDGVAI